MIVVDCISKIESCLQDIEGVVFDLDDTLYGEKEYVKSGYKAVGKAFPQIPNMAEKLWQAFQLGKPAIDYVLESEGLLQTEVKEKCLKIYRQHIPEIHLYESVEDIFNRLLQQGKMLGVITDGRPEGQRNKIKSLNLEKWISHIIVTDELGGIAYRKPCPIAFENMQRAMNVSFSKMVYIGDNVNKDFIAPTQLGMRCIYFKNKNGLYYKG